jgi:hypothetical protein
MRKARRGQGDGPITKRKKATQMPTMQQFTRSWTRFVVSVVLVARLNVRATDPDTSHTAGANIAPEALSLLKQMILDVLTESGPLTHDEIHARCRQLGIRRTPQRVRTATSDLVTLGRVKKSNLIGISNNGGDSHRWELVTS